MLIQVRQPQCHQIAAGVDILIELGESIVQQTFTEKIGVFVIGTDDIFTPVGQKAFAAFKNTGGRGNAEAAEKVFRAAATEANIVKLQILSGLEREGNICIREKYGTDADGPALFVGLKNTGTLTDQIQSVGVQISRSSHKRGVAFINESSRG